MGQLLDLRTRFFHQILNWPAGHGSNLSFLPALIEISIRNKNLVPPVKIEQMIRTTRPITTSLDIYRTIGFRVNKTSNVSNTTQFHIFSKRARRPVGFIV